MGLKNPLKFIIGLSSIIFRAKKVVVESGLLFLDQ